MSLAGGTGGAPPRAGVRGSPRGGLRVSPEAVSGRFGSHFASFLALFHPFSGGKGSKRAKMAKTVRNSSRGTLVARRDPLGHPEGYRG